MSNDNVQRIELTAALNADEVYSNFKVRDGGYVQEWATFEDAIKDAEVCIADENFSGTVTIHGDEADDDADDAKWVLIWIAE